MTGDNEKRGRLSDPLSRASVQRIADAVRAAVLGKSTDDTRDLLDVLQLGPAEEPSAEALDLYEAAFVHDDRDRAREICRGMLLRQPLTQALLQSLAGRPPMTFSGVLHLLARHHLANVDEPGVLRRFLSSLNDVGIVVWSTKNQMVRSGVLDEELDVPPRIRVIQPGRSYTNVMHLRQILRACEDFIWWAEPHLNHKALEPLAAEVDPSAVRSIRLLSGPMAIDDTTRRDWSRFRREMSEVGIDAQWRVLAKGAVPFHDRYLLGAGQAWNVPPVNTVFKGSYAEATRCDRRPPFQTWWDNGGDLQDLARVAA